MPTGWGVVTDLIFRLAALRQQNPTPDPDVWYREQFGENPRYDRSLRAVAKTQVERQALLRRYFEPTEEERERGLKVPSPAHRAIARLVSLGYSRVILTTNFDRLIEQALEAEGITPSVIASMDALQGARPYIHSACTLVKLHGDYLDTRIRNTPEELASYPAALKRLLSRIFDEFGLIACGWSGEWDTALRDAILRAPGRRFATYWVARGAAHEVAKQLIDHRDAEVIPTKGADAFFGGLVEQMESLRELERPDPLSVAVAVATMKRYLAEDRHRIRLHDLVAEETERTYREVTGSRFDVGEPVPSMDTIAPRMRAHDAALDRLTAMVAAIGYFGERQHGPLLRPTVERLGPPRIAAGVLYDEWTHLQSYPALLLIYAAGIPAFVTRRFDFLAELLLHAQYVGDDQRRHPLIERANVMWVMRGLKGHLPEPYTNSKTPGSDWLANRLRSVLHMHIPGEQDYVDAFDQFEYFFSLVHWHCLGADWAPIGAYGWRQWGPFGSGRGSLDEFVRAAKANGEEWGLFQAGFFGGDTNGFDQVRAGFDEWGRQVAGRW